MMNDTELMRRAIALSIESVKNGGGPFGAVIARNGEIVAEASNSVTLDNDPTAHAEVNCIRQATRKLGTFSLEGCVIYTSCEPKNLFARKRRTVNFVLEFGYIVVYESVVHIINGDAYVGVSILRLR